MALFTVAIALATVAKKPLAAEPLMGATTRVAFGAGVTEDDVIRTADLMEATGLLAAGYTYLILDDGATLAARNESGHFLADPVRFPEGFKRVADYLHEKEMLFGMYAAAGTATCAGGAGSIGYELKDAQNFVELEIDLLKYEFCNNPIYNAFYAPPILYFSVGNTAYFEPWCELRGGAFADDGWIIGIGRGGEAVFRVSSQIWEESCFIEVCYHQEMDYSVVVVDINGEEYPLITVRTAENDDYSYSRRYFTIQPDVDYVYTLKNDYDEYKLARFSFVSMADALAAWDRDIVFMVSEWGLNKPYEWAPEFAHMWRVSPDIAGAGNSCSWYTILRNYETVLGLYEYSGKSAHNDADLLCAGMAGISDTEAYAQISLWAMIGSPLVIGADVARLTDEQINILTNQYVKRVNQDKTHIQAIPVERDTDYDILLKPLDDGFAALLYFNKLSYPQNIKFDLKQMVNWFDLPAFANASTYRVVDAWYDTEFYLSDDETVFTYQVYTHSVAFLIVTTPI